jgi:hypothetical protein
LNTLLVITEKSGNLWKDLRQDIVNSLSTLRNIFVHLGNNGEEQSRKINELLGELTKTREELAESRVANLPGSTLPSRGGIGQTTATATHHQLTPCGGPRKLTAFATPHQLKHCGGPRKLYSEVVGESVEKRFKLMVKPKLELSTEEVKKVEDKGKPHCNESKHQNLKVTKGRTSANRGRNHRRNKQT